LKIGDFQISVVTDGTFWLDGGTMFGVVPKAIWGRLIPADDENRIELGLNCLLVRSPRHITLVDAGIGRDFSPRKMAIYRIDTRTNLVMELAGKGVQPQDVDRVILTHLHFDHAGWCTHEVYGRFVPTFPKARYVVQAAAWQDAHNPSELMRGGYMVERLEPLKEHGRLDLVDGETDLGEGIAVIPTPAHARGHQCVRVTSGVQTIFCPGDIIPTRHHLRLAYVMAYDRDPEGVVEMKSSIMQDALTGGWIIFFTHDPKHPFARLEAEPDGDFAAVEFV
jgi:glyoxylase-like metal-dependent hydrolase (beta-lactamase superfamily II)